MEFNVLLINDVNFENALKKEGTKYYEQLENVFYLGLTLFNVYSLNILKNMKKK